MDTHIEYLFLSISLYERKRLYKNLRTFMFQFHSLQLNYFISFRHTHDASCTSQLINSRLRLICRNFYFISFYAQVFISVNFLYKTNTFYEITSHDSAFLTYQLLLERMQEEFSMLRQPVKSSINLSSITKRLHV